MRNDRSDNKRMSSTIIVRHDSPAGNISFPDYRMVEFPNTWMYSGCEGSLDNCNAFFHGPHVDKIAASRSIIGLYEKYKHNGFITRFETYS